MELAQTISVCGIEFEFKKFEVRVSPPNPKKPKRYYANVNPVSNKMLFALCRSIEGCWAQSDFVEQILNRRGANSQSVTGFDFHDSDDHDGEPADLRFELKPDEHGVFTYYLEETVEVPEPLFVTLAIQFVTFCLDNGIASTHSREDLDQIRKRFNLV